MAVESGSRARRWPLVALAAAGWTAAWMAPWQEGPLPPSVRTGVAWLALTLPGMCWALLIGGRRRALVRSIAVGPALSLALLGLVVVIGSWAGASMASVDAALFSAGLIGVCGVALRRWPDEPVRGHSCEAWLAAAVVVGAALTAAWLARAPAIDSDDYTYLAQITGFLGRDQLSLELPIAPGRALAPARFWFVGWALAQAWLARAARVDPLALSTLYVDPFVAAWSIVAIYALGRTLRLSPLLASTAAVTQLLGYTMLLGRDRAGVTFLTRLNQDKAVAAFALAPVLFATVADMLARPGWRRGLLLGLSGVGLLMVHPPLLGMAALIGAAYVTIEASVRRRVRGPLVALAILLGLVAVPFMVRLIAAASLPHLPFSAAAIARSGGLDRVIQPRLVEWAGGYAVAPRLLGGAAYVVLFGAAVVGLPRLRQSAAARLVLAAALTIAATLEPHAAALLALGVTYVQLWRLPWLAPFGIAAAVVIECVFAIGHSRRRRALQPIGAAAQTALLAGVLCLSPAATRVAELVAVPSDVLQLRLSGHRPLGGVAISTCRRAFADLAVIARALDRRIAGTAVAIGDREMNDLLPALSPKTRVVVFRGPQYLANGTGTPRAEVDARMQRWATLLAPTSAVADRLDALDALEVEYLLVCGPPSWSADLQAVAAQRVETVARSGALALYRIAPAP